MAESLDGKVCRARPKSPSFSVTSEGDTPIPRVLAHIGLILVGQQFYLQSHILNDKKDLSFPESGEST